MTKKYNFLNTEPVGEDLFEGKAQERIADIIVDIIGDDKFKVIGIDGGWGSGKSNLIKLIEGKIPDHNFFLYDVWGHQEDEQRKAILAELTDYITNKKIVSKKDKWAQNLQRLLAKTRETKVINLPHLSIGFIFSLFSIVYVPVVNTFKDKINTNYLNVDKIYWQIGLVALPLILVFTLYLVYVIKNICKKNGFFTSLLTAAQETFQVYTNKQREETKIETVSDNQPSVREFQKWMREIDSDLGQKKLILVFDNFDRLPKQHILSIWSVIHIFFAEMEYKNIKIIIPFDRLHIKNAFKELNNESHDYANDYINKTFDIVYRVAPPILSGWKEFLKNNWVKAFITYNEQEYIKVEQAYEVFRPNITPREILAFVNEVVALKMLDDSIPDRYIAVFVLNKEKIIEDPLKAVTNLEYLKGVEYSYRNDSDFQKFITALAYQIKAENALEVVYKKELKDSLQNENDERLNEISKTSVFNKILGTTISEIDSHIKPILTLFKLNSDALISEVELQTVWDDIFQQEKNLRAEKWKVQDFQIILLQKISSEFKLKCLEQIINNLYSSKSSVDGDNDFTSVNFVENVDLLGAVCAKLETNLDVFDFLQNREIEVEGLKSLIDYKKSDYWRYKIQCSKEKVLEYLSERTIDNFNEAKFIFYLEYKYELRDFHEKLRSFISGRENDRDLLSKIFEFLKKTSKEPIVNPLHDAQIYTLMNETNIDEPFFVDLACMRIKLGTASRVTYAPVYEKALNSEDNAFYASVAEQIENYISFEDILISSISFQNKLMQGVVSLLIEREGDGSQLFNTETIINGLLEISNANNIEAEKILLLLDKEEEKKLSYEFVSALSEDFYHEAIKSGSQVARNVINVQAEYFKNGNNEIWQAVFSSFNSKELNILLITRFTDWNSYAIEALKHKLLDLILYNEIDYPDRIQLLFEQLLKSGKSLDNTFKDVRDKFISTNAVSKDHFTTFMPWLFKYGSLSDKASDVMRVFFKPSFLDDSDCVRLMTKNDKELKNVLTSCLEMDRADFEDGIRDRVSVLEVEELARKLYISLPK